MLQAEDRAHSDSVKSIAAFQTVYLAVGIPWNMVVIGVILLNKLYSRPTHMLLLNLAVSDLLVCVSVMPFNVIIALSGEVFIGSSDYARCQFCHFYVITIIVMIYSSIFTVAVMSVDRLIYVTSPLRYDKIVTVNKMLIILILIWPLSIAIGLPPVFGFGEIKYSNIVGGCSTIFSARTRLGASSYYIAFIVIVAIIPSTITVVCNTWLLCVVRSTVKLKYLQGVRNLNSPLSEHRRRMKSKYTKQQIRLAQVFGGLFLVNIITWIPNLVTSFVSVAIGSENVSPEIYSFVFLVFLSQPAVHPILESFLVEKVRNLFCKCIHCNICCKKITRHQ